MTVWMALRSSERAAARTSDPRWPCRYWFGHGRRLLLITHPDPMQNPQSQFLLMCVVRQGDSAVLEEQVQQSGSLAAPKSGYGIYIWVKPFERDK